MRFPAGLRALNHRDFRLFISGQLISLIGTRIMSIYAFVFVGVTPIGSFFVGAVAEWFGVSVAYAAGGGLGLLSVLALAFIWMRRGGWTRSLPEE